MVWPLDGLEREWQIAAIPEHPYYLEVLTFWVRHREKIPAPIFFIVPPGCASDDWQPVIEASQPLCRCGRRRWLLMTASENIHRRPGAQPVTIYQNKPLAIGPWGGDKEAVRVELSVADGALVTHMHPYTSSMLGTLLLVPAVVPETVPLLQKQSLFVQSIYQPGRITSQDLRALRALLPQTPGKFVVLPYAVRAGAQQGVEHLALWILYGIAGVDIAAQTVDIIPSGTVGIIDPAINSPAHQCD